ncbi:hypothetical protein ACMA1I_22315 [Pontibacter sp. 13R65]|uniref:hypothetical protein n=1 Tax=Pontibacter sp. 13R65 TaxID=3127458 RepID=UPI00301E3116
MRILLSLIAVVASTLVFPSCKDTTVSPLKHVRFDPELLNRLEIADSSSLVIANPAGMQLNTKQVQVIFRENTSFAQQQELLNKYGFVQHIGMATPANSSLAHTLDLVDGLDNQQVSKVLHLLEKDPAIVAAKPTFRAQ